MPSKTIFLCLSSLLTASALFAMPGSQTNSSLNRPLTVNPQQAPGDSAHARSSSGSNYLTPRSHGKPLPAPPGHGHASPLLPLNESFAYPCHSFQNSQSRQQSSQFRRHQNEPLYTTVINHSGHDSGGGCAEASHDPRLDNPGYEDSATGDDSDSEHAPLTQETGIWSWIKAHPFYSFGLLALAGTAIGLSIKSITTTNDTQKDVDTLQDKIQAHDENFSYLNNGISILWNNAGHSRNRIRQLEHNVTSLIPKLNRIESKVNALKLNTKTLEKTISELQEALEENRDATTANKETLELKLSMEQFLLDMKQNIEEQANFVQNPLQEKSSKLQKKVRLFDKNHNTAYLKHFKNKIQALTDEAQMHEKQKLLEKEMQKLWEQEMEEISNKIDSLEDKDQSLLEAMKSMQKELDQCDEIDDSTDSPFEKNSSRFTEEEVTFYNARKSEICGSGYYCYREGPQEIQLYTPDLEMNGEKAVAILRNKWRNQKISIPDDIRCRLKNDYLLIVEMADKITADHLHTITVNFFNSYCLNRKSILFNKGQCDQTWPNFGLSPGVSSGGYPNNGKHPSWQPSGGQKPRGYPAPPVYIPGQDPSWQPGIFPLQPDYPDYDTNWLPDGGQGGGWFTIYPEQPVYPDPTPSFDPDVDTIDPRNPGPPIWDRDGKFTEDPSDREFPDDGEFPDYSPEDFFPKKPQPEKSYSPAENKGEQEKDNTQLSWPRS